MEEHPDPDEEQEDADQLDGEESVLAVPGEARVAEGLREARVVDRERLGADGGQAESQGREDGR